MICSYLIVFFSCPYIVIIAFSLFFFFCEEKVDLFCLVCLIRVKVQVQEHSKHETTISHWCVGDNRYFHWSFEHKKVVT